MKNERNKSDITKALYETDGFVSDFEATVISCKSVDGADNKYAVILDRTAFFPEGGGQQADKGLINGEEVIDVQTDVDGHIIHYVSQSFSEGEKVTGKIDFDIRLNRMQNHSAEHIVSGLIHELYGYDNVGFHMSEAEVRLDVNGTFTDEQIADIEKRANEVVYKNVPITISYPTAAQAEVLEYRSKIDILENIRIVTIEGVDVCACCAPHVNSTGQIGVIKILDYMPHRQGTRITMVAGMDALNDYVMLHRDNAQIMALLSSKRDTTANYASDFMDRHNKLKEENTALKYELTKIISESVIERIKNRASDDNSPEVVFTNVLDNLGLRNLINACTDSYPVVVCGFIGDDKNGYRYIISSGTRDVREIAKKINEQFLGKGGGSAQMVQGSLSGKKSDIISFVKSL